MCDHNHANDNERLEGFLTDLVRGHSEAEKDALILGFVTYVAYKCDYDFENETTSYATFLSSNSALHNNLGLVEMLKMELLLTPKQEK